jgi:hypothetical protein
MRHAKVEVLTRGALRDQQEKLDLFSLDARCLDLHTRQELRRLFPSLLWVGRALHAHFLAKGCLHCHRKKVSYGSGGMCQSCVNATRGWLRQFVQVATKNRDTQQEIAALSRKVDVAQRLLNSDE